LARSTLLAPISCVSSLILVELVVVIGRGREHLRAVGLVVAFLLRLRVIADRLGGSRLHVRLGGVISSAQRAKAEFKLQLGVGFRHRHRARGDGIVDLLASAGLVTQIRRRLLALCDAGGDSERKLLSRRRCQSRSCA
jgi:hypothetical protein